MPSATEVVGRDRDLNALHAFIDRGPGFGAMMLEGEPGIGKTTLWDAAASHARDTGRLVLCATATGAETGLAFASLADLLEPAFDVLDGRLPPPQQRAIDIALLRADPAATPIDARAIGTATLTALRLLAGQSPLLIAIDDLHWTDPATADALAFAVRRLRDEPVKLLATVRPHEPAPHALAPLLASAEVLALEPLSLGALHRLIRAQLGTSLRRPALVRVAETSGGNPLHALELARLELRSGQPDARESTALSSLLRERLARLPAATLDALLTVAVLGRASCAIVLSLHPAEALEPALEAHVLQERDDTWLTFTHPLLGAAVYGRESVSRRRQRHRQVAALIDEPEERALHLGLGTESASAEVAAELSHAAAGAARRGAPARAAELLDDALRLTPAAAVPLAHRRRLDAAVALFAAGDSDAAEVRLRDLVSELGTSAGRLQAEAHRQLANVVMARADDAAAVALLQTALRLCPADENALRAWILRDLVWSAVRTGPVDDAFRHGEQAVVAAERSGEPDALVQALAASEYARFMAGRTGAESRLDEAIALERRIGSQRLGEGPRAVRAYALMVSFEVAAARPLCHELLQAAVEQGDTEAEASALYYLARVETFAGRLDAAEEYAARLREVVEQWGGYRDEANFADAALAALRGRAGDARRFVAEQLAAVSAPLSTTRLTAVLGALSLSEGDSARAAAELRHCEQITIDRGLREPGAMRFRLDLVEALVGIGELEEAQEVQDRFEMAARELGRRWALAAAERTRALLLSAAGDPDRAVRQAARALEDIKALDSPLERARALLTHGTIARRAKLRGLAREALEHAHGEFSALGVVLWAERARTELRRLGGRTASATELTETERRVAELVATGVSNKAAAAALFVSVRAVEANLTRVYTKLGVRSRAELAARLTAQRETTGI